MSEISNRRALRTIRLSRGGRSIEPISTAEAGFFGGAGFYFRIAMFAASSRWASSPCSGSGSGRSRCSRGRGTVDREAPDVPVRRPASAARRDRRLQGAAARGRDGPARRDRRPARARAPRPALGLAAERGRPRGALPPGARLPRREPRPRPGRDAGRADPRAGSCARRTRRWSCCGELTEPRRAVPRRARAVVPGRPRRIAPRSARIPQGALGGEFLGLLGEVGPTQLKQRRYHYAKPGEIVGQSGVEASYDRTLNGGLSRAAVDRRLGGRAARSAAAAEAGRRRSGCCG